MTYMCCSPTLKIILPHFPHVRITISCQSTYQTLHLLDEAKIDGAYWTATIALHIISSPLTILLSVRGNIWNQKKLYPYEPLIQAATFMMLDEDNITRQTVNAQLKHIMWS